MKTLRPLIYLAGVYSGFHSKDISQEELDHILETNVYSAIDWGAQLIQLGALVHIPHLQHFVHNRLKNQHGLVMPVEYWLAYDLRIIQTCNAIFRFSDKPSSGTDLEINYAQNIGILVLESINEVESFLRVSSQTDIEGD